MRNIIIREMYKIGEQTSNREREAIEQHQSQQTERRNHRFAPLIETS